MNKDRVFHLINSIRVHLNRAMAQQQEGHTDQSERSIKAAMESLRFLDNEIITTTSDVAAAEGGGR